MNTNEAAADLMETTADRFESGVYLWHQGDYEGNVPGSYCLVGGLLVTEQPQLDLDDVEDLLPITAIASNYLSACLSEAEPEDWEVPSWNDEPGRELHEVIELLKQGAKDLRNLG